MGQEASRWKVCAELEKILFVIVWCGYVDIWYCALKPYEVRPDYQHELWLFCRLQCGAQSEPERDNARQMAEIYALHCCCQRASLDRYLRRPLRNCEGFIRRTLRLMIVAGARQSTCKSGVWLHKCHRLYKGLCGVSAESIVSEQRRDRENKLWIPQ